MVVFPAAPTRGRLVEPLDVSHPILPPSALTHAIRRCVLPRRAVGWRRAWDRVWSRTWVPPAVFALVVVATWVLSGRSAGG